MKLRMTLGAAVLLLLGATVLLVQSDRPLVNAEAFGQDANSFPGGPVPLPPVAGQPQAANMSSGSVDAEPDREPSSVYPAEPDELGFSAESEAAQDRSPYPAGTRFVQEATRLEIMDSDLIPAEQLERLAQALFGYKNPNVMLQAEPTSNSLEIRATEEQIVQLEELINRLEDRIARAEAERRAREEELMAEDELDFKRYVDVLEAPLNPLSPQIPQPAEGLGRVQQLDEMSRQIASEIREAQRHYGEKHPSINEAREKLLAVLNESFALRQVLQGAEFQRIRNRLVQVETQMKRREEHRDQIVTRRMNELLGASDELSWEGVPVTPLGHTIPKSDFDLAEAQVIEAEDEAARARQMFDLDVAEIEEAAPADSRELPPGPIEMNIRNSPRKLLIEARFAVEVAKQELEAAMERFDAGGVSKAEIAVARLELQRAELSLEATVEDVELARQQLLGRLNYLKKAAQVAEAELEMAEDVSRKSPGAIPVTEMRRLQLSVERSRAEIDLVQTQLGLFGQEHATEEPTAGATDPFGSDDGSEPDEGDEISSTPVDDPEDSPETPF